MSQNFPDTTAYQNGVPTELTQTEQRRGPSLPVLCALLVFALLALLFAMTEVLAAEPRATDAHLLTHTKAAQGSALGGRPPRVDPASLVAPAEQLLLQESAALGEVRVQINPPDSRLDLPACASIDAFLPPGARAQGHTTVGVRCRAPTHWTVYLQAQVQVFGSYLAAAHPLAVGQVLAANDIVARSGDLSELPNGVLSDLDLAVGHPLASALATGQPLRRDSLKTVPVVLSGQSVRVVVSGRGFEVAGEGVAIANAGEGQSVQVRTPRGSVISGTARSGALVEVHL
jgi:flagella basal body P-ring formation protein FlgA